MNGLIYSDSDETGFSRNALDFCQRFREDRSVRKYLFGRNVYAQDITSQVEIDGFIDDFSTDRTYMQKPVIRSGDVPKESLVLVAAGGRPLTARKQMDMLGIRNLDYFAFYRFSGLSLRPAVFNENFDSIFRENRDRFEWVSTLFADDISREIYQKLINFRLSYNIEFLSGFQQREHEQYYEDFLNLNPRGEVFVDVGGYDGFTSLEFIKRCPDYDSIHVFEPDDKNNKKCHEALGKFPRIFIYKKGLSNSHEILHFSSDGSASRIVDEAGGGNIEVDRLDALLPTAPSFIKMDIEGAEMAALEGAEDLIKRYSPRLAISVYHKPEDFFRVPEKILSLYGNYSVYLRHYTESIYETIMFFIPKM